MNASLNWLKAYVPDLDVTDKEFTDAMTLSGTKVEGHTRLDKNLEKIVIGQIKEIKPHPDADKLVVCQVDIGSETLQIVTGAKNMKEGDKVAVVTDGGKVAGGHDGGPLPEDGIAIKAGKLRGVESYGMMCAICPLREPILPRMTRTMTCPPTTILARRATAATRAHSDEMSARAAIMTPP